MKHVLMILLVMAAAPAFAQDHHAGHHGGVADPTTKTAKPAPPQDHAADAYYDPAAMAEARANMKRENGGMTFSQWMIDRAEYRVQRGRDIFEWEGEGWIGGDIDRLAFRTKGEREARGGLDHAEIQALYSRAINPWFNLEAGVRQDFGDSPNRTYAAIGVSGLAPYWFEVEGTAFVSNQGDLHLRIEGSYDQRLTQRLILQPALELNFAAQAVPEQRIGSGLSDVELGLRLRYEFAREFAPYVGVNWERKLCDTAHYARQSGENAASTSLLMGVRFWF